jgi:hypothetical protein
MAEQQDTGEQGQAAAAGDRQGHAGADARFVLVAAVSDEEERREAGDLPEDQQQEQVFGQHDAQHRRHEQQQNRIETPETIAVRQVPGGVEHDQQADAENQQAEQQAEAVEAQAEVETVGRQPAQLRANSVLPARAAGASSSSRARHGHHHRRRQRPPPAPEALQQQGQQAGAKGRGRDGGKQQARVDERPP